MEPVPYTNEELAKLGKGDYPQRGHRCRRCGTPIPRFAGLSNEELQELQALSPLMALKQLMAKTGCNLNFAKVWAAHPNGLHERRFGPPCPYCGVQLFSEGTRQCLECGWDWHDPDHPRKLTKD